jgi:hypothetical protein
MVSPEHPRLPPNSVWCPRNTDPILSSTASQPHFELILSNGRRIAVAPGFDTRRCAVASLSWRNAHVRTKWSQFSINGGVAMSRGLIYSRSIRPESRSPRANGVAACQVPHLMIDPRSLTSSFPNLLRSGFRLRDDAVDRLVEMIALRVFVANDPLGIEDIVRGPTRHSPSHYNRTILAIPP